MLEPLQKILRQLPADLPASVFLVRHIAPESFGVITRLLQAHTSLRVSEARDGEAIENGRVYIAPADRHLLLDRETVKLTAGPKENWSRPAIDPLFRTAAQHHGPRSIGIILSGKLDDGAAGLWALKRRGGFAVVQAPGDALAAEMPLNALAATPVDVVAAATEIGARLPSWCRSARGVPSPHDVLPSILTENQALVQGQSPIKNISEVGISSPVACPECGGHLWRMKEGPLRYRCHVGHALSAHTLLARQRESIEDHAWRLMRALEEDAYLAAEIAHQAPKGFPKGALAAREQINEETLGKLRPLLHSLMERMPPEPEAPSSEK